MGLYTTVDNPCERQKDFCINCNSNFMKVRPSIRKVVISKRFIRDLKDREIVNSIVRNILDCSRLEYHELHKFEKNVNGNLIFRAKKGKMHVVYGVDREMRIIFMRAIRNFVQYKKFLESEREILKMVARSRSVD
ncbi:MAG: hypothetical protein JSW53_02640 [Candidatus Bathyarchaeota archaeon]|nr:MAG: hypothetical protein JSW53_02640 [Candidatus Bathyarchaeota archaeon]